jgi:hypothetical protein
MIYFWLGSFLKTGGSHLFIRQSSTIRDHYRQFIPAKTQIILPGFQADFPERL